MGEGVAEVVGGGEGVPLAEEAREELGLGVTVSVGVGVPVEVKVALAVGVKVSVGVLVGEQPLAEGMTAVGQFVL